MSECGMDEAHKRARDRLEALLVELDDVDLWAEVLCLDPNIYLAMMRRAEEVAWRSRDFYLRCAREAASAQGLDFDEEVRKKQAELQMGAASIPKGDPS